MQPHHFSCPSDWSKMSSHFITILSWPSSCSMFIYCVYPVVAMSPRKCFLVFALKSWMVPNPTNSCTVTGPTSLCKGSLVFWRFGKSSCNIGPYTPCQLVHLLEPPAFSSASAGGWCSTHHWAWVWLLGGNGNCWNETRGTKTSHQDLKCQCHHSNLTNLP